MTIDVLGAEDRNEEVENPPVVTLREMSSGDLARVEGWLREPHVARWYMAGSTIEEEVEDLRLAIAGDEPTQVLVVLERGQAIGWCQWYFCRDYPEHAEGVGAEPEDVGIDYAIGDPTRTGHGVGTELIAALVLHVRRRHRGPA